MQTTQTIQSDALLHVNKMTGGSSVYELRKLINDNQFDEAILLAKRIPQTTANSQENRLALVEMLSAYLNVENIVVDVTSNEMHQNNDLPQKIITESFYGKTDVENQFEKSESLPKSDSFVSIMSMAERDEDGTFMANGVRFSKNAMIEMINKSVDFPIPFYAVNSNEEKLQIGSATLMLNSEVDDVFGKVEFDHNLELENFNPEIFNTLTSIITDKDKSLNSIVMPLYSANMVDEQHIDGIDCISLNIFDKTLIKVYTESQKESLVIAKSLTDEQKENELTDFENDMNDVDENSDSTSSKEV